MDALFFDVAGTLIRVAEPVGRSYLRIARRHGLTAEGPGNLEERLELAFRRALKASGPPAYGRASVAEAARVEKAWWRGVVEQSLAPLVRFGDFEGFFEDAYRYFGKGSAWCCVSGCRALLEDLSGSNLKLGLISNFDSRVDGVLRDLGLRRYFEVFALSGRVGAAKPDPEIFKFALQEAGVPASRALHLGDNYRQDFVPAQALGMKALLFDPKKRCTCLDPGQCITCLAELRSFLL